MFNAIFQVRLRSWKAPFLASIAGGALLAIADGPASFAAPNGGETATGENVTAAIGPSEDSGIKVVVVSARRRVEKSQDVPISLSVVNADALEANGISNTLKLNELVPSLQVISFNPRNTSIVIRGLGANVAITNDGLEAGVGVYVDGVLYARPAQSTFDLPDIASIEELRGPQGTLYGKNAIAGALNITTELPSSTFQARASASVGDWGYNKVSASVSGPVTEGGMLRNRLSVFTSGRDGFVRNVTTGRKLLDSHDYGVRDQVLVKSNGDFTLRLIGDYSHNRQLGVIQELSGVVTMLGNGQAVPRNFYQRAASAGYTPLPFRPYDRLADADAEIHARMEQGGLSAQADWDLDGYTLTSITAYRFWNWDPSNDVDLTRLSVFTQARQANEDRQFSQELRIASPTGGKFSYSGGLYYFWEKDDGFGMTSYGADAPLWILGASTPVTRAALNGLAIPARSIPRTNSYAAYGQATWHILPDLDFTAGLRYTYEDKTGRYWQTQTGPDLSSLAPAAQAAGQGIRAGFGVANAYRIQTSNGLRGGLATLTYRVTDTVNAYATFSHGEKSAGLNLANLSAATPKIVAPEAIDNYELGFKSSLFRNRLTFNADLFWSNDTNYQTTLLDQTRVVTYLANIPGVRSRGLEADIHAAPLKGLTVSASGAYTDASYQSYPNAPAPFEAYTVVGGRLNTNVTVDLSGRPLPAVSKWVLSVGGEYDYALAGLGLGDAFAYVGVDESYRTGYFSNANLSRTSKVPGYALTNARIGVRSGDGHWDLAVWSRNLLDRNYFLTSGMVALNSGATSALLGDPRTVGATLSVRF